MIDQQQQTETQVIFEPFSHNRQVEYLENLKNLVGGLIDQKIITDIQRSVLDSKGHAIKGDSQIHITLPLYRYRSYMDYVVTPEQKYMKAEQILVNYAKFLGADMAIFNKEYLQTEKIKF